VKELLDNLNNSQKEAVIYNEGPSLIIAGAGSGKTRVLTYKIAALLKSGLPPWTIMALTFTNKAAREMKERIGLLVDSKSANRLWMGTFHSIFLKILRSESSVIGYPADFTIYDTADSKSLIKSIIKDMNLDDKIYKPSSIQSRISAAKNDLISPVAYAANRDIQMEDLRGKRPQTKDIFQRYVERCRLSSAMDFDDILLMTNVLFRDHPEILEKYQDRFNFILVDEYQDTNFSQYLIVKKLAEKHHKVCVVGDDSQSIYSFRGANIENILNFKNSYPECRLFKLEQNYRSTQNIVNAANSLIAKNKGQIRKTIFSEKDKGQLIRVLRAYSDLEEGFIVANKINEMRLSNFDSLNDFVILYRTNAQSRIFEESLRKRNLPYRVYGGLSFYQRKEIKDVIAYLRLILNPDDEEAFKRVINYPARGIGETTQQKLLSTASSLGIGISTILNNPEQYNIQINSGTAKKIDIFRDMILKFRSMLKEKNVYEVTEQLLRDSGIINDVSVDNSPENISRKQNIQELLSGMNDFTNTRLEEGNESIYLSDYLSEVSLLTDQDEEKSAEGDRVTMMTIHAAKGLEFKNVFVVGLEEDIFPSSHSLESEKALEEERRLLYVAITRAENVCTLSYANSRFRNGQNNFTKPSRFLADLDPKLLDFAAVNLQNPSASKNTFKTDDFEGRAGYYGNNGSKPYSGTNISRPSVIPPSSRSAAPTSASSGKPLVKIPSSRVSNTSSAASGSSAVHNGQNLKKGQSILHERFGVGTINEIEGSDSNCTITVEFENSGSKRLLLKFAKFTLIE
jgi:DNA helicase II / ATP-dependent DNA helicase PcrA